MPNLASFTQFALAAASLRSWVDYTADSDFPIQNLPYGVFSRKNDAHAQCALRCSSDLPHCMSL